MSRTLSHVSIIMIALVLAACSSSDSGSGKTTSTVIMPTDTYSLSGTITSKALLAYDSDLNNPASTPNISNNTFADAQTISNYFTINGFASAERTNQTGDRFKNISDNSDIYQVNLEPGQVIRLQNINFQLDAGNALRFHGDLDLVLFNSQYQEVKRSNLTREFESITVPAQDSGDQTYFIQVLAYSGISKYVLKLEPITRFNKVTSKTPLARFKTNEAIIKFKTAKLASASTFKAKNMQSFALNHTSYNRPMLAKFETSTQAKAFSIHNAPQGASDFLSELEALNPESYDHYVTLNTIKQFRLRDDVEYAQPNYIRTKQQVPNDPLYIRQWHYPAINLPQAWDLTTGTPDVGNVIVAVIDTGVFLDHEDLRNKLVPGYDFISDPLNQGNEGEGESGIDPNPDDPGDGFQPDTSSWHGTHVAGTIAAETNNNLGLSGVSWGAKIMPLRVLGPRDGTDYDIGQAALFAAGLPNDSNTVPAQKADIINMSLGGPGNYTTEDKAYYQDIFSRVRAENVIIVAAAGNESSAELSYPASFDGVISVAATNAINEQTSYSNFGTTIDVAAPGGEPGQDLNNDNLADNVWSTLVIDPNGFRYNAYRSLYGTSMATPHVAGVIALMRAVYPDISPDEIDTLLTSGSITTDLGASGRDNIYGHGLIDAYKAVNEARRLENGGILPSLPPILTATPSSLNLGSLSSGSIIISNIGDGNPIITSFSVSDTWLSISPGNIDELSRLGTYNVNIDRSGLPSSSYMGNLTFQVNTETNLKTIEVPISMFVSSTSTEGNIDTQYVVLIDTRTGKEVHKTRSTIESNGQYNYQFDAVLPGTYQILGGSDIDNDQSICKIGESCGEYPVINQPTEIKVVDADMTHLDFVADILSSFNASRTDYPTPVSVTNQLIK